MTAHERAESFAAMVGSRDIRYCKNGAEVRVVNALGTHLFAFGEHRIVRVVHEPDFREEATAQEVEA